MRRTGLLILGVGFCVLAVKASPGEKTSSEKKGNFSTGALRKTTLWGNRQFLVPVKAVKLQPAMLKKVGARHVKPDSLSTDSNVIQQVYTTSTKRMSVVSSASVSGEEIAKSPVVGFTNGLTGRLAGLYTLQSSGIPGNDLASLTLRGQTPLIIIDGIVANLTSISLEEIESVTVLKDALATSMLGVRGAHGAVLVTTKKGKTSKQRLSLTVQSGIQKPLSWNKPLNSFNYATLRNEALKNDGVDINSGLYYPQVALDAYRDHTDPLNYPDVDYRKEITKNQSLFNRYTLSTTGGGRFARYFVSLDHVDQRGLFISPDSLKNYTTSNYFKSYAVRSNIDLNITNKISAGIYLLGRIQNSNEPGAGTASVLANLQSTPANAYPLLNSNGSFAGTQLFQNNLLAQTVAGGYRQAFNRDILVSLYLKRSLDEILKGMWIKAKASYNSTLTENITRNRSFAVFQPNSGGYTQFGNNGILANGNGVPVQGRMDYQELSLGYDVAFDKHNLNVLLLANRDNSTNAFSPQELPYTILGTSGRFSYNYDGRFIVEGSFGLNGSNRYPDEGSTKFGFFPAMGLGWNLEREGFMKSLTFVDRLKVFTSYGVNGWDNPGYFNYYPRFYDSASPYFGTGAGTVTGITEGTLPNSGLTFEKANKFNIGVSGSILSSRLSFTAEYFNNKYYDLVMQSGSNSALIGNSYSDENVGKQKYFGWEGQLNWQDQIGKVKYFVGFNLNSVGSKVLGMEEAAYPHSWMQRTGQPVNQTFGYIADGLFQDQAEIDASAKPVGYTAQPGDIKYRDLNSDGKIDQYDVTAVGTTKPLFFYGVSFGLGWKSFDLSALLQGVENRNLYVGGSNYWAFQNNGIGQAYEHNLNRWTPANAAGATYPRLSYGANLNNNATSSFWARSGDYFRLKNVELGYTLPSSLVSKVRLSTVRVFATGYNLFAKSSDGIDDRDPEAFFGEGGYPLQRVFNFGVNVKF